jgi:unsaturated rhamnogalacturonyl hydrolase
MNTRPSLQRELILTGIDKIWSKLTRPPKDMGENLSSWEWIPGTGMYGVAVAYENTKEERFDSFLNQWSADNAGKLRFGSVNWVVPANALLHAYQHTGNPNYLHNCWEVADWCLNRALRTTNGGYAHVWGPGAGGLEDYKNQLWLDTLFMAGVFMVRFGVFDRNVDLIEEALKQFDIHIDCQFDQSCDLFYHGYHCLKETPLGQHWGRGNGWAAVSLVELLDQLHDQPYDTSLYEEVFKRQMESVYGLRMKDGMLRTLLDEEEAYLETSASALFAYAALKGNRLGLLDEKHGAWGEQIIGEILANHIDEDGTILHASGGTDCQEKEGYLNVPYQSRPYTSGIGLMLLTESLRRL